MQYNESQIEFNKEFYPSGTRIRLHSMHDEPDMPRGLEGTVNYVDDAGQIQMNWDNGRTLALIPEADVFEITQRLEHAVTDGEEQTQQCPEEPSM